jgi:hypothetical protein
LADLVRGSTDGDETESFTGGSRTLLFLPSEAKRGRVAAMALADTLYALLVVTPIVSSPPSMPETRDQQMARLWSIAEDAVAVAGEDHPADALLILAVAQHESGFALDVDRGPCRAGTCDGGLAACMLQIQSQSSKVRAHLFADRRYCFSVGLQALKHSRIAECPQDELQFAAYAGGSCARGARGSRDLYNFWQAWLGHYAAETATKR